MICNLTPLGNTGYIPTRGDTTCFMLEIDDTLIFLDSGTGLKKLYRADYSRIVAAHAEIHFVFSHYHLDHVIGISYWPKLFAGKTVIIHAPQPPLTDASFEAAVGNLLSTPLFSLPFREFPMTIRIVPVTQERFSVGQVPVRALRQEHPGGSVTYRFGDLLVFATDTGVNPKTFSFSTGVDLLVHEVWFDAADSTIVKAKYPHVLKEHSAAPDLVEHYAQSQIAQLALTHLNPEYDEQRLRNLFDYFQTSCKTFLTLREGTTYQLHGRP